MSKARIVSVRVTRFRGPHRGGLSTLAKTSHHPTFLARALVLPPSPIDVFIDDNGSVFEANVRGLAAAGITPGCNPPDNARFCPDDPVTRGQMAALLVRALGLPNVGDQGLTDIAGSVCQMAAFLNRAFLLPLSTFV